MDLMLISLFNCLILAKNTCDWAVCTILEILTFAKM
jgi:hypothetical protein